MKKKTIINNNKIKVLTTGRYYDFIGTIENKTDKDIYIGFTGEYYDVVAPVHIKKNDWIGVLANEEGYDRMNALSANCYTFINKEVYDNY